MITHLDLPAWVAPGIIIIIVILVNLGLVSVLRSKNTREQIDIIREAAKKARQPWQHEDKQMEQLQRRVAALRAQSARPVSPGADKSSEEVHSKD